MEMITRLKYIKNEHGNLVSYTKLKLNSKEYAIVIQLHMMVATIYNVDDFNCPVVVLNAKTVNNLKILAKKELTKLGFKFKKENRKSKKIKEEMKKVLDEQQT